MMIVHHLDINAHYQTITDTQLNGEWFLEVWSALAMSIYFTGLTITEYEYPFEFKGMRDQTVNLKIIY